MKIIFPSLFFASLATTSLADEGARRYLKDEKAAGWGTKIVGGDVAGTNEFPWFVDLNGCGASLIAPDVVLSAAHCDPTGSNLIGWSALVGAYDTYDDSRYGEFVSISDEVIHPNYDDWTVNNDFMLLKLAKSVSTPVVGLNKDPNNPNTSQGGTMLTVIGVGATSEGGYGSDVLLKVDVPSISDNTCAELGIGITDSMFCAGELSGGKDSCQGDSGGPIVNGNTQVGVVSWGYGCARPDSPGVYAQVSSAYDWIKGVVCDDWNSDASFCDGGGSPTAPTPTAPVSSPTQAPVAEPTAGGDCVDGELAYKDRPKWDCAWVAKKAKKRCNRSWAGKKLSQTCRLTCETCNAEPTDAPTVAPTADYFDDDFLDDDGNVDCADDPDFLFKNKPGKDCDWVAKKPWKLCYRNSQGFPVWSYCPEACGYCGDWWERRQ